MINLFLLLALLANLTTVLLWHFQLPQTGKRRALVILAAMCCFALSTYLFSIPYAWTRAPFIALGVLGLSGWLYVFSYPLMHKAPFQGQNPQNHSHRDSLQG